MVRHDKELLKSSLPPYVDSEKAVRVEIWPVVAEMVRGIHPTLATKKYAAPCRATVEFEYRN